MTNHLQLPSSDFRLFNGREVRRVWREGEWWYSTADAVGAFSNSANPAQYWRTLKHRLIEEGVEAVTICNGLKLPTKDGRSRKIDASSEQMLLRIVQSMPQARLEHIRQWLAEVGAERLREERDPELITERAIETNKRRYGMSDAEASQAVQGTAARKQLTSEWQRRGIAGNQYAILTNVGHQSTFDIPIKKHKAMKGLQSRDNLRPHLTPVERALAMLQETTEEEIIQANDLQGFYPIQNAAQSSGAIAARARIDIEKQTRKPVVSPFNRKRQSPASDKLTSSSS
jgi:hypothetical protein